MTERMLTEKQLSERWNVNPSTLRMQRQARRGCSYLRLGGVVRYRESDVRAFEEAALVQTGTK